MEQDAGVVFGRRPVTEALRAGSPVQRIQVGKDASGLPRELFDMAKELGIPIVRTDKDRLDFLSRNGNHQGVVAQLGARSILTYEQWEEQVQAERGSLLLALDQVQDPQNLGALLRSADGAGCRHVLLSAERSCGLTSTVSKTSAGADQHLVIGRTPKMGVALEGLRDRGYQVVATSPRADLYYHQVDFRRPTVILLGGEERGLPPHLRRAATVVVKLPMLGRVESLNVASSGSIMLYEAVRQRARALPDFSEPAPTFETERLVLRALAPQDAPTIQKQFERPEVTQYLNASVPSPYPEDGAQTFLRNVLLPAVKAGRERAWAIELGGQMIGAINISNQGEENRGFWLAPEYWGHGFMREASDRITAYVLTELGWPYLVTGNAAANVASSRMKRAQGFERISVFPKAFVGGTMDYEQWKITREDWIRRHASGGEEKVSDQ